ncbi:hypothetical protein MPTK1_4g16870 [Marchantia polymorpha subsp. ruderalis]|uniref:N-acetyltransferase domain-containing protein n=2 Tax=Marchantia polymorpha TaxID=3197 RepID=A0AAF6BAN2_MARPO|nr:hypothetical protein MARPO_0148s0033 [Marchantia polymorpha]BBN09066.1 hypothetical protein Mp_4g16870 [Marchantia polymorpha subsp. ruderalis]|eukprot:PTQ29089.1 hypothetical protein MARPO_0148s0033 [Marchantia polymorpha]
MAIHSQGLQFQAFPNQRISKISGATSSLSASVAGSGFSQSPYCRISPSPRSSNSLSSAFSAKCSLAPTSNVFSSSMYSGDGTSKTSCISSIPSRNGKCYRTYRGHVLVSQGHFRHMLLISRSLECSPGSTTSFLPLAVSRFEFHGRRVKNVLYRIMKLSTPFCLSWSMKKSRPVYLRVSRASSSGMRHVSMNHRCPYKLRKCFVTSASLVSRVEFNHFVYNKVFRGSRGFQTASDAVGLFNIIQSLRSQAEGHGIPEKVMLAEEVTINDEQMWASGDRRRDYLAVGYGWRVRAAALNNLEELMRVADIQTDAFHITAAAFDDLFYKLFHAEVLSSLQYKARHSPPDRYSCLLAEKDPSQPGYLEDFLEDGDETRIVGAVDVTALMDSNIVSLLPGAYEYLYISGMAVDSAYRRRSVATLLLEACIARASDWGFKYLVLHAYEDDIGARNLYSRAGFRTVGGDALWMTKFLGRRRRVVMARRTVEVLDTT